MRRTKYSDRCNEYRDRLGLIRHGDGESTARVGSEAKGIRTGLQVRCETSFVIVDELRRGSNKLWQLHCCASLDDWKVRITR